MKPLIGMGQMFAPTKRKRKPRKRIEDRFTKYHNEHPEVARRLAMALAKLRDRGLGRPIDFRMVVYHTKVEALVNGDDPLTLSDHFSAHYARLVADSYPDLAPFIKTRRRRTR